ncbi:hypothetical protein [Pseudidiomarina woesei]|uniref:Uncharacterized protein n=1 Tax=Pseudidiomarina woesei TaxID=1381080 RepID=A0A0K6HBN3_9GAMM|nr:hypothetical protein [Pseudidiomarina woesei]CUA88160.1 hypothetical protein Ga0061064_2082 [Pseudidiomarina woesei]
MIRNIGVLVFSVWIATVAKTQEIQAVELPPQGDCQDVTYSHNKVSKWPLLLRLCHYSADEFNALIAEPVLEPNWLPTQVTYQGLANSLLDSRMASIALAHGQRWYSQLAANNATTTSVVQLTDFLSPYFGCAIVVTNDGFSDPCTNATWDKLGRLQTPVTGLANQSLRHFPFSIKEQTVYLGLADENLAWQPYSFEPNLHDASVPLLERVGKGLFWGLLTEVQALWPEVTKLGSLSETEQSHLFIMAVAKERGDAICWLVDQGLNPAATNEFGDNALTTANMIESEAMVELMTSLMNAQKKQVAH